MTASDTPPDGRITTERDGHVFMIGIDRPKKLNGFSPKMLTVPLSISAKSVGAKYRL